MQILIVGAGAREHAIAYKLMCSSLVTKLWAWPSNPALNIICEKVYLKTDSYDELVTFIKQNKIDLVIVGPENHLAQGLSDILYKNNIKCFGPNQQGAQLESSKAFAKELMLENNVPTAQCKIAHNQETCLNLALKFLAQHGGVVLKADGLAAGKGVFVCKDKKDVIQAIERLYKDLPKEAIRQVVVEELLSGKECSFFCFVGSDIIIPLGFAVDYKRLMNNDVGPNTGGMGCYSPVPWLTEKEEQQVLDTIIKPTLKGLEKRNIEYCGCIYAGLMLTAQGFKVLEFNVRLGDPETQVLCLSNNKDWTQIIAKCVGIYDVNHNNNYNHNQNISYKAVGVVMASKGYPFNTKEDSSTPIPKNLFEVNTKNNSILFGANLLEDKNNPEILYTGKGRVLTVVGFDQHHFSIAKNIVYKKVNEIYSIWKDCQWRQDIAKNIT